MAVDKLVDSTQLNADLTSVANAIRTKGGTSGQLAFPAGFVQAIGDISGGGGGGNANISQDANGYIVLDDDTPSGSILDDYFANAITDYVNNSLTEERREYSFRFGDNTESVTFTKLRIADLYSFAGCLAKKIFLPALTFFGRFAFGNCTRLEKIAFPSINLTSNANIDNAFNGCRALTHVDFGENNTGRIGSANTFRYCPLEVVVIRQSTMPILYNISAFQDTPFYNGGAGGEIYIPKSLYDHLGDGTALDYKAATNWSTVDGYGTITWRQIEGSAYEDYYVDGTPVT